MTQSSERALVVAAAREWVGTPYHHMADIKGVGVDCGMLIVRCFVDTGLCEPFDPRPYAPDWHMHRNEERYLGFVFDRCKEVEKPQPGDVMVFRLGRCYSHGAIVTKTEPLMIVHAFAPWAKCVEMRIDEDAQLASAKRVPKIFSFWKEH